MNEEWQAFISDLARSTESLADSLRSGQRVSVPVFNEWGILVVGSLLRLCPHARIDNEMTFFEPTTKVLWVALETKEPLPPV